MCVSRCTDNGVMVAWAAVEALRLGRCHEPEGLQVRARWPIGAALAASPPARRGRRRK